MTREEILALPAGRALDALVAELVMGWTHVHKVTPDNPASELNWDWEGTEPDDPLDSFHLLPDYSTDIGAAWEVVDRLECCYLWKNFTDGPIGGVEPGWYECKLARADERRLYGIGSTAPLAICRAALLAVLDR